MRLVATLSVLALNLAFAASAFAHDNGEGTAGETDDKLVTFFSLGVVLFFAAFVTVATIIQTVRDRRKEEKKVAALHQRIGW